LAFLHCSVRSRLASDTSRPTSPLTQPQPSAVKAEKNSLYGWVYFGRHIKSHLGNFSQSFI
jgi:hypothetical protein